MSSKPRILAVDDQAYFRTHLEEILREAGFGVETAEGGREALHLLERDGSFDLVLTDLVMPEMDGIETVEHIRDGWPDLPIIVITAVGDVRSAVAAMRRGASDYLLKPLDREGLLASIESVLATRRLKAEHDRLVTENLAYMGRLSLYERATGLFALEEPAEVASKLLELYALECGARAGALWTREADSSRLRLRATRGEGEPGKGPLPGGDVVRQLEGGPVLRPDPQLEERLELWLGSYREGSLVALARLLFAESVAPGEAERSSCARLAELGALALDKANAGEADPGEVTYGRDPRSEIRDAATDLATLGFLSEVARIELHKAQRYGRSFGLLCIQVETEADGPGEFVQVIDTIRGCLRSTDILSREPSGPFWVLLAESDPIGGIVLKRRIADRLAALAATPPDVSSGLATFPQDGTSLDGLLEVARRRAGEDRRSLVRSLGLESCQTFAELTDRLLERGETRPSGVVASAADLVIGDLASRPGDRGLLFLAPGGERTSFLAPLVALGQVETATEVFVAVDGDTLPDGPSLHALPLSSQLGEETSWIVRLGEAPAYALLAGPPGEDGKRRVFHASDPGLVEHLAFQLRGEVGFGVRA